MPGLPAAYRQFPALDQPATTSGSGRPTQRDICGLARCRGGLGRGHTFGLGRIPAQHGGAVAGVHGHGQFINRADFGGDQFAGAIENRCLALRPDTDATYRGQIAGAQHQAVHALFIAHKQIVPCDAAGIGDIVWRLGRDFAGIRQHDAMSFRRHGSGQVQAQQQPAKGMIAAHGAGQFRGEAEDEQGLAVGGDLQPTDLVALERSGQRQQVFLILRILNRSVDIKRRRGCKVANAFGPRIGHPHAALHIDVEIMHGQMVADAPFVGLKLSIAIGVLPHLPGIAHGFVGWKGATGCFGGKERTRNRDPLGIETKHRERITALVGDE